MVVLEGIAPASVRLGGVGIDAGAVQIQIVEAPIR
jgi:hypothetical protein